VPVISADPAREALVNDLLWLTHEGYVIEYADGRLESVPPPKHSPKSETTPSEASAEGNEVSEGKEQASPEVDPPAGAGSDG
jgi:hypothetical protein